MENEFSQKSITNFRCEVCDYTTSVLCNFKKHNESMKHKRNHGDLEENKPEKYKTVYECKKCEYITNKKSNYDNHLKSNKHCSSSKAVCPHCSKLYSGNNNLWKHLKICKEAKKEETMENNIEIDEDNVPVKQKTQEMFMDFMKKSEEVQTVLIKQNEEYRQQILELTKQQLVVTNNMNNTTNNNTTNNNQFNLNVFLNEKCKDAINIMDFIESLQLQISDLEQTGKLGYIDGITRIFVNGLKELDVYKRPIHCTDIKRETVYVKDKDAWEKENEGKPKLKTAINKVSQLNLKQLKKWQEQNPEYQDLNSEKNDEFIHLSTQAIGCYNPQENEKNTDKIMKNVLKQVIVDKT